MGDSKVVVGNVTDVSGEVNIAGSNIYKGYTAGQVEGLLTQITSTFQPSLRSSGATPARTSEDFPLPVVAG